MGSSEIDSEILNFWRCLTAERVEIMHKNIQEVAKTIQKHALDDVYKVLVESEQQKIILVFDAIQNATQIRRKTVCPKIQ